MFFVKELSKLLPQVFSSTIEYIYRIMKKAPIMFTKTNTDKHVTQALTHLSVFNTLTFRVLCILQLVNACFKLINERSEQS